MRPGLEIRPRSRTERHRRAFTPQIRAFVNV
jgi:hypothetical protein